jgi:hypothetical protein
MIGVLPGPRLSTHSGSQAVFCNARLARAYGLGKLQHCLPYLQSNSFSRVVFRR